MISGTVFDIKRYAINDGPGIRTTIFFKGCPLSCVWCHNPESISFNPQKLFTDSKCIGCQSCADSCPHQACHLAKNGIITDTKRCTTCGECANACPSEATEISGRVESVDSLMKLIRQEIVFFDQSGGGVTFSGGEPLSQPKFLLGLLEACGQEEIHRTVDTSGYVSNEILMAVAEKTDLFLYDLKIMDPVKHKRYTGVDNQKILDNLKLLTATGNNIFLRVPLIKGINTDTENIKQLVRFIKDLPGPIQLVNLLPYHNIAANKYVKLGTKYQSDRMEELNSEEQQSIVEIFTKNGLPALIGG